MVDYELMASPDAGTLPARLTARLPDVSGTIYGTIVAASTILAAGEGTHNVGEMAATVVVTLLVYWAAHSYAEVLGGSHAGVPFWDATRHELATESSMISACVLPVAGLLISTGLGAGFEVATSIALWLAVGVLFVFGVLAAGRGQSRGWILQFLSGILFGLLGIAIVMLKTFLLH